MGPASAYSPRLRRGCVLVGLHLFRFFLRLEPLAPPVVGHQHADLLVPAVPDITKAQKPLAVLAALAVLIRLSLEDRVLHTMHQHHALALTLRIYLIFLLFFVRHWLDSRQKRTNWTASILAFCP